MNRSVSTLNPLPGGLSPTGFQKLRGLTHQYSISSSAPTREATSLEMGKGSVVERVLEVAAITYLRVSGLEGLGSPIISGVGSG